MRSICAFLNSGGGILIWGAPLGRAVEGRKEKIFQGELSPITHRIEKDSYINKISDSITPMPNNVMVFPLESEGRFICLFEVQDSEYSPHQFKNNYHMRLDGQTRIAPHHYIEALFRKITYPHLKGFIKLERLFHDKENVFLALTPLLFNLSKLQNEHNLYYRIVVTKGIFENSSVSTDADSPYRMGGHEKRVLKALDTMYYNEPYRSSEVIRFDYDTLQEADGKFEILLYFGGKLSPLRFSKYDLQIDLHNLNVKNLNELFIKIEENTYTYDHSTSLGKSDEERIKMILGR
jgi:hypothetical protein